MVRRGLHRNSDDTNEEEGPPEEECWASACYHLNPLNTILIRLKVAGGGASSLLAFDCLIAVARTRMSLSSMHTMTAGPSRQSAASTSSSEPYPKRPCATCGRYWPWVTFDVLGLLTWSSACTRCAKPDLEVQRWFDIHNDMRACILKARHVVIKKSHELREQAAAPSYNSASIGQAHAHATNSGSGHPVGQTSQSTSLQAGINGGGGRGSLRLNEQALEAVSRDPTAWRLLKEPVRAAVWLQLHFRPASPNHRVRQTDIYQTYYDQVAQLSPPQEAAMSGAEVIKLLMRIWNDPNSGNRSGIKMEGRPMYTISGLEARQKNDFGQTYNPGQPIMATPRSVLPQSVSSTFYGPDQGTTLPQQPDVSVHRQSNLSALGPLAPFPNGARVTSTSVDPSTNLVSLPIDTVYSGLHQAEQQAAGPSDHLPGQRGTRRIGDKRSSRPIPDGVEVIVIDEDSEGEEDEWAVLKGTSRRNNRLAVPSVKNLISDPVPLAVQPRSSLPSTPAHSQAVSRVSSQPLTGDRAQKASSVEEEIDELDSDID